MRNGLLIVVFLAVLGLTSCAGDDDPLTGSEYRAAGNELCEAWSDKVSDISGALSSNPSQQEFIDAGIEIADVAADYTEQLLDLTTPDSSADDRAALQARIDEYEVLTENTPETEGELDAITDAGNAISDALGTLWSACR